MKKVLVTLFALVLLAFGLTSCNKNSPKEIANNWLTGFYHLDYESIKQYSTEDTKTLIASLQQFTNMVPDSAKKDMKKLTVNVKDVKVDGDKAVATYTVSDSPGKDQALNLVKQNGKWLVLFSKEDQMNSGPADNTNDQNAAGPGDSTGGQSGNVQDSAIH